MIKIPYSMVIAALQVLHDIIGIIYQYGKEIKPGGLPTAEASDCSETSERLYKDYLNFILPDGAQNQYQFCKSVGKEIGPEDKPQPLDLVFLWKKDLIGKEIGHVAIIYGELSPLAGTLLIEARGAPWNHVMPSFLDTMRKQFGPRFAGVFRLIEIEGIRAPDKA